ncbi:2Fe-2S iron-sulfur cluster binding domain-containing protein [Bradyrhizobium jicamae]|uniref:2Fe-2S iron-sulfur cluster-binding protein n=1 Tax=Bradyrhizobium jicamae TaxID=280332 RepID=UPI001BAB2636|nr:2Fe-2S iron-sulfur cluster-binding protein [Bradyrhizobium jicamae]MBR0751565.1 2Fe-2S iron-sulfur cluster binding domain-containing protein [Bradyrhizobium jicamae]
MPKITFVCADGATREVIADLDQSIMEAALAAGVPGIVAECNGAAACATCHCYFESAYAAHTGEIGEHESEMLDFTASERTAESRLSCQVRVAAGMEGMTVRVPPTQ